MSWDSISIDPAKVEALVGYERPKNVIKIYSFFGMAKYCIRFTKNISNLAASITDLTKKGVRFEWTKKFENVFREQNIKLTLALICYF